MIQSIKGFAPSISSSAFVAPNATVIGEVCIADHASIWHGAVLRGDVGKITVGANSNIQDNAVLHCSLGKSVTVIGENVTVGHGAIVHGAIVEDNVLIGMNATVLDNARIGKGSVIAAGAVVLAGTIVPPHTLWAGVPAKQVKESADLEQRNRSLAQHYVDAIQTYSSAN